MNWRDFIFGKNEERDKREARMALVERLADRHFYCFAHEEVAGKSQEGFIKQGGNVFGLFNGTHRMHDALYKECQGHPWIKILLEETAPLLNRVGIKMAISELVARGQPYDGKRYKFPDAEPSVHEEVDSADHDLPELEIVEEFSAEGYMIAIGHRQWVIWDQSISVEDRSILERQRVLDIVNDMLKQAGSEERLWHCWGEKGGESLFLFLTPELHSIIVEASVIDREILPIVDECPWTLIWDMYD